MSRRKRTRAQRDRARVSNEAQHRAKVEAYLATPRPPAVSPLKRVYTARGGTQLVVDVLPVRVPFDPGADSPPEGLREQALDAFRETISRPPVGDA